MLELLPLKRINHRDGNSCTRWSVFDYSQSSNNGRFDNLLETYRPPHRGSGRVVQPGQKIHASVIDYIREHDDYVPAAQFYPSSESLRDIIKEIKRAINSEKTAYSMININLS